MDGGSERERDCVCVCVCVCERERERERESVCVCVCVFVVRVMCMVVVEVLRVVDVCLRCACVRACVMCTHTRASHNETGSLFKPESIFLIPVSLLKK